MKDIIDYYEDGGPSDATPQESHEMKRFAREWQVLLKKEFYENANPLGRQGIYLVLKTKKDGDVGEYPTKRFVGAWLRRQMSNQINRTAPAHAPSIQSIITSQPNELLQSTWLELSLRLFGRWSSNHTTLAS